MSEEVAHPERCLRCAVRLTSPVCSGCGEDHSLHPPGSKKRCARCGYDLRGLNTDRCPECGASGWLDDVLAELIRSHQARRRSEASFVAIFTGAGAVIACFVASLGIALWPGLVWNRYALLVVVFWCVPTVIRTMVRLRGQPRMLAVRGVLTLAAFLFVPAAIWLGTWLVSLTDGNYWTSLDHPFKPNTILMTSEALLYGALAGGIGSLAAAVGLARFLHDPARPRRARPPARCFTCGAGITGPVCSACNHDHSPYPAGFELRCSACGYDLTGLDSERCPECGRAASLAELLAEFEEKRGRAEEAVRTARTRIAGALAIIAMGVGLLPLPILGWPGALGQVLTVSTLCAVAWVLRPRSDGLGPVGTAILAALVMPSIGAFFMLFVTAGVGGMRHPTSSLIVFLPALPVAIRAFLRRPFHAVAAVAIVTTVLLGGLSIIWLNAGIGAVREGAQWTGVDHPWKLAPRPTLLTTEEALVFGGVSLTIAILAALVAVGCGIMDARRPDARELYMSSPSEQSLE